MYHSASKRFPVNWLIARWDTSPTKRTKLSYAWDYIVPFQKNNVGKKTSLSLWILHKTGYIIRRAMLEGGENERNGNHRCRAASAHRSLFLIGWHESPVPLTKRWDSAFPCFTISFRQISRHQLQNIGRKCRHRADDYACWPFLYWARGARFWNEMRSLNLPFNLERPSYRNKPTI